MAKPVKQHSAKGDPKPLDAVQIIKADHKLVRNLFERFHRASQEEKGAISGRLLAELDLHTKLEEELIYPELQANSEGLSFETPSLGNGVDLPETHESGVDTDQMNGMELVVEEEDEEGEVIEELIIAAYDDHQTMKDLMQQLRSLDPTGGDFHELLTELEEKVFEHVSEEEVAILPLVAAHLDVQAIGTEMQRRKDDFQSLPPIAA